MPLVINVGDVLELKKQHPCGSKTFLVMRTGMDFRLTCQGCNAQVWIARKDLEKRIKKITSLSSEKNGQI
jgi:hypothetical protein